MSRVSVRVLMLLLLRIAVVILWMALITEGSSRGVPSPLRWGRGRLVLRRAMVRWSSVLGHCRATRCSTLNRRLWSVVRVMLELMLLVMRLVLM